MDNNIKNKNNSANEYLEILRKGNKRYRRRNIIHRKRLHKPMKSQSPFATILACSDSRTDPNIIFDQKLGSLFNVRNAGNIASNEALGTIEYGVGILKTSLVLILGHTYCGAVEAAISEDEFDGKLDIIVSKVRDNIHFERNTKEAEIKNILKTMELVKKNPVVKEEKAFVTGAYFDVVSGEVVFLEE